VDRRSGAESDRATPPPPVPREPRQRWRIAYARGPVAAEMVGRVALEAWGGAVVASGLPIAGLDAADGRPKIAFAAPLPAAASGEHELMEVWLVDRVPLWRLRESIAPLLPDAHRWVDAEDVWLGAPALAGQVAAADWRIELDGLDEAPDGQGRLADAAAALTAARTIPRLRLKGSTEKPYDLRRLLLAVGLDRAPGHPPWLTARTRFDPALGSGRPEEVVAALADASGLPLGVRSMTRTRLILADELRRAGPTGG
jgi:hypothetical protein